MALAVGANREALVRHIVRAASRVEAAEADREEAEDILLLPQLFLEGVDLT